MDMIVTPKEAAKLFNANDDVRYKASVIRKQCADGVIKNVEKVGTCWYINASKEWPHLFGQVSPQLPIEQESKKAASLGITANTTIGELFEILASVAGAANAVSAASAAASDG